MLLLLACAGSQSPPAQSTPEPVVDVAPVEIVDRWADAPDGPTDATPWPEETRVTVDLAEGIQHESPTLAVSTQGQVYAVFVRYEQGRETLILRTGDSPETLGPDRVIAQGPRAWAPRLEAGADGSVWLAWCGRGSAGERGSLSRDVLVQRVDQDAAPVVVSEGAARSCDPDLAVDPLGGLHVVWEEADTQSSRIAYRSVDSSGQPSGPIELLSPGWLDRRPAVAADARRVWVAWDSLTVAQPSDDVSYTGPVDPKTDLRWTVKQDGAWAPVTAMDRPGIQAAPHWVVGEPGVALLFHDSSVHGLVKWWAALKLDDDGGVSLLRDPMGTPVPEGESQGAEFPTGVWLPDGGLAVVTRRAHGTYVHVAGSQGVQTWDLTRAGWGARGLWSELDLDDQGNLLVTRRARKSPVIEVLPLPQAGAATGWVELPQIAGDPGAITALARDRAPRTQGEHQVFWGDVHMHSALSDGTGPADEIYARVWARGLDFAVLTDHDTIVGSLMVASEREEQVWLTELFDGLPGFTTLQAYEWTTPLLPKGSGHRNVYYRGMSPLRIPGSKDGTPDTAALWQALSPEDSFAVPHHTTWTGTIWDDATPENQRHVELISVHGLAEKPGDQVIESRGEMEGMYAVDALAQGLEFGFLGGSDAHGLMWHHGIARRPDPWTQGLTGVLSTDGARAPLWDALYARRTIASSGVPLGVVAAVGGQVNGGSVQVDGDVVIQITAWGTRELQSATLVRDGVDVGTVSLSGVVAEHSWTDAPESGRHSYHVRVVQQGDAWTADAGWSSPVFVEVR